eukprot:4895290-Pyramimonas_sp.AAC.1
MGVTVQIATLEKTGVGEGVLVVQRHHGQDGAGLQRSLPRARDRAHGRPGEEGGSRGHRELRWYRGKLKSRRARHQAGDHWPGRCRRLLWRAGPLGEGPEDVRQHQAEPEEGAAPSWGSGRPLEGPVQSTGHQVSFD